MNVAESPYDSFCSKSELELYKTPPVNASMEKGEFVSHQPVSTITATAPIEFHIPGSPEEYVDLGRTQLYLKLKVCNIDNTPYAAATQCAPVNLLLHSLFSQVDVKFRDTLVTPSINTYAYKSYLETLLSFGEGAKRDQKTIEGWYKDVSDAGDAVNGGNTTNTGLEKRTALAATSNVFEIMGRPHVDVLHQDRYLIPGVSMSFKFMRSASAFHLMSDANTYKVVIEDATMFVRKVKLNPSISIEHAEYLNKGEHVKYPVRRGIVTTFTIGNGLASFNRESVISGQIPRRIIMGFVENTAFNGLRNKNPFNFKHFGLNHLSLSTGGQNFPSQPLRPNYANGEYMLAYNSLLTGLGLNNADKGLGIDRHSYLHGNVLYAFDLTADMAEGAHIDPIHYGSIRVEAAFANALPNAVNAIIYAEYDNVLQIDRARNVVSDFQ